MKKTFTKSNVKRLLGMKSDAELGRYFGRSRATINLWPNAKPIPELYRLRLQVHRPDLFGSAP